MYKRLYFEISGICNANCKYCANGKKSISGRFHRKQASFIGISDFERAIRYLLDNHIIGHQTLISLYQWGEPLLHPRIKDIIEILLDHDLCYSFSTNASFPVYLNARELKNLSQAIISMSGFSQQSYDRIHGFNFEKIKSNMVNLINRYSENGFLTNKFFIAYHLYQFNIWEVFLAKQFAESLNVPISYSAAYFNDYNMFRDYLTNKMPYETLKDATSELLTYYYSDVLNNKPLHYDCPQNDFLSINENCEVLLCCGVGRNSQSYSLGKIFNMSLEEIQQQKISQPLCIECDHLGINYINHTPLSLTI
ncbi:MAG TPA: hypothetical protein DCG53_09180 [Syntrophus sp. (in: bacteria)]|nr:hypothetical protein [Syntrophus sp. (in: bacteria)]